MMDKDEDEDKVIKENNRTITNKIESKIFWILFIFFLNEKE
jgi:hypothetical protein